MRLSSDDLPMFFGDGHGQLAERLRAVVPDIEAIEAPGTGADEAMRDRSAAAALARTGLFELVVPRAGEQGHRIDTRSVCLAREMLGYISPRADSILAVQGLGTHALGLAGSADQRAQLPAFAAGRRVAAFALTEPEAGSDVAAIATRATQTATDQIFIVAFSGSISEIAATTRPAMIDEPIQPYHHIGGPSVSLPATRPGWISPKSPTDGK